MAEWVGALRAIFACWQDGEPLAFEGRWTRHTLMPPTLTPPRYRVRSATDLGWRRSDRG